VNDHEALEPPDFVTCGEVLAAFVAEPFLPLGEAHRFTGTVAGSEFNVAIGLARLGYRAGFAARVGDDALGAAITRRLRGEGVEASISVDPSRPTGILVRDSAPAGPVEVVYGRAGSAGSALAAADVPLARWRSARSMFLSGTTSVLSDSSRAAALALARSGSESGAVVALDPNVRRRLAPVETFSEALRPLLEHATVVISGEDELFVLTGTPDPDESVKMLLERPMVELVVVKRGAKGAYATDGHSHWEVDAAAGPVLDTVGAGDAFAVGLLSALLDGEPVPEALARGSWVASLVVATVGDIEGLPSRRQLSASSRVAGTVR
jgi:2-dehydro-3-deoxygluconokinase